MKRWRVAILIFELLLLAAILILPQVDLPAAAFHEGRAPVVAHARVCDPAAGAAVAVAPEIVALEAASLAHREAPDISAPVAVHSRLSRLCVLLC